MGSEWGSEAGLMDSILPSCNNSESQSYPIVYETLRVENERGWMDRSGGREISGGRLNCVRLAGYR